MKKKDIYYTELQWLEWEKEYFLKIPEEILTRLDLEEGDELKFEIQDDSTIIISKVEQE